MLVWHLPNHVPKMNHIWKMSVARVCGLFFAISAWKFRLVSLLATSICLAVRIIADKKYAMSYLYVIINQPFYPLFIILRFAKGKLTSIRSFRSRGSCFIFFQEKALHVTESLFNLIKRIESASNKANEAAWKGNLRKKYLILKIWIAKECYFLIEISGCFWAFFLKIIS